MLGFDEMAIFAAVVENGSFTAAGHKLSMPKSTVSQKVAQLETHIGVRLLNRSTRKLHLTGPGEVFFSYCQQMVQQANMGKRAIAHLQQHSMGKLRITCPEVSARLLMPKLLSNFHKRNPQVTVELIATDEYVDLIENNLDFAFRAGKLDDSSLICRTLGKISRLLVASPNYLNQYGHPQSPDDLVEHRCLKHLSLPLWPLRKGNKNKSHKPPSEWSSNNITYLLQSTLRSHGITLLPTFMCVDELKNNQLEIVLSDWKIPDNNYYLIYPSRTHLSKAQRSFIDFVMNSEFEAYINIKPAT